jgi:beta-lactamase superfamily II metal-dependent hydrolase
MVAGFSGCYYPAPTENPPPNAPPTTTPPEEPPVSYPTEPDTEISDAEVTVHVLSVKAGESVLIDSGDTEVLIDAGKKYTKPSTDERTNVSEYISKYIPDGKLEYVIATHADSDHIGGLPQIYKDFQVDHTIYGNKSDTETSVEFEAAAKAEPNSTYENDTNEIIPLGDDVSLEIIDMVDDDSKSNNNSVISLLHYHDKKVLVTGDAEKKAELALIGKVGAVDAYIVGHHGSNTSSSVELLSEISPAGKSSITYGIISSAHPSTGYKHPRPEIIERLLLSHIKIFATYRSGDIIITFKGDEMSLSPPDDEEITIANYLDAA